MLPVILRSTMVLVLEIMHADGVKGTLSSTRIAVDMSCKLQNDVFVQ